jgi:endonuclease/exonuclease/phosphatase family metal-dependent hydrolase
LLGNLHASNSPDRRLVVGEIERAASFLAGADPCILCGDFNVRGHTVPGFTQPIDGIDQILVRGLTLERGPEPWPEERRRVGGLLLSDHAPVEAVVE